MASFDSPRRENQSSRSTIRQSSSGIDDGDDAESQFLYVQSMSAGQGDSSGPLATPTKTDEAALRRPPANALFDEIRDSLDVMNILSAYGTPRNHNKRASFTSSISQYLGKVEYAGVEPVSVVAVNQDEYGEDGLKRGLSITKVGPPPVKVQAPTEETTPRLSSEASFPIGALETVNASVTQTPTSTYSDSSERPYTGGPSRRPIRPDVSTHTSIDSPVPPRSAHRPKSGYEDFGDILASTSPQSPTKQKRNSRKRSSLSVTDGLDELMRDADQFNLRQPRESQSSASSIDSAKDRTCAHEDEVSPERLHSEALHDLYLTADEQESTGSTEFTAPSAPTVLPQLVHQKLVHLPPRPTADNIKRARDVSQQISLREREDQAISGDRVDADIGIDRSATIVAKEPKPKLEDSTPIEVAGSPSAGGILRGLAAAGAGAAVAAAGAAAEAVGLAKTEAGDREKFLPPAPHQTSNNESSVPTSSLSPQPHIERSAEIVTPMPYPPKEQYAIKEGFHPVDVGSLQGAPTHLLSPMGQPGLVTHDDTAKNTETPVGAIVPDGAKDDDFYDVEPVTKPPRAKSVKHSTVHHRKKNLKKKGRSTSGALKPFSYQTLISLLESTNGTVIGEEFSQLDLPAKEKQLIEKIIDALSRLSADMVLDKDRYEVGLSRLENALRVLEGFM